MPLKPPDNLNDVSAKSILKGAVLHSAKKILAAAQDKKKENSIPLKDGESNKKGRA